VDAINSLLQGFGVALQPMNLVWAFVGSVLGTAIGVLPGIGPALTIALLLPVTTQIAPTSAFIMFAGVLYGAMYGGSTTSILLNTPGESGSMMTALEGNRMARSGRGAAALATAAIGSFVAGTIATLALTFAAPAIAEIAFIFGPADYFALMVLAFTCVAVVMGASRVRGFISLFLGLALGVIGIDQTTGQARLTFGSPELLDGIELTIVLVSLFAVGETIYVASRYRSAPAAINPLSGGIWMTREDWRRSIGPWLRGTAIGFPIGTLPAGGSEIPTFLSYAIERRNFENAGRVRPRRHRGRRRSRSGQQRRRGGHPGAAAHARAAHFGDRGGPSRRIPELRPAARAVPLRHQRRPGVGPDRLPLRRQRHAAGAQPAARRACGCGSCSSRGLISMAASSSSR
jgi:putative tricarboxylic transport membrane protein